ncbi:MAG: hypothetical protein ACTS4Z_01425 [Candidatus Hodgkinia cicadicola]
MEVDNLISVKSPKPCPPFGNVKHSTFGYILTKHCGAQTNVKVILPPGIPFASC